MSVSPFTFYRGRAVTAAGLQRRDVYVRQLRDMKGSAASRGCRRRASRCTARSAVRPSPALARTGDAAKIAGYLGDDHTFDRALERFAAACADQNEADYTAFSRAADDDRVAVQRGV